MCVSPIIIDNPNFHNERVRCYGLDVDNSKLAVPCGVCCECVAVKQMSMVQRVQMEATKNRIFFGTLTYSNDMLPHIGTSTGYDIAYADIRDIQLMIKRLRNDNAFGVPFRFLVVSEFGSEKGRPHFHLLYMVKNEFAPTFGDCINLEKTLHDVTFEYWSRNVGSNRSPIYKPCCEYHSAWRRNKLYQNYDLHYVIPSLSQSSVADVAFYVLKYMMKPCNKAIRLQRALKLNLPDDEYEHIWPIVRPSMVKSLGFGYSPSISSGRNMFYDMDIVSYLRSGVKKTPTSYAYPLYFNPDSGNHFPLGRFYRSNPDIYSAVDAVDFYLTHDDRIDLKTGEQCYRAIDRFMNTVQIADTHSHDDEFTNL